MILIASCIAAGLFIILKACFPLADFFVDSTNYVEWAYYDLKVAYRPTGYSNFLRLAHLLSASMTFTVFVQYLLFFTSTLFCFFSTDYLYGLPQKLKWPVLVFLIVNPLLVLQTNLISSDTLFCSLTVVWFTSCLWITKEHKWWALILQLVFLYFSFKVRYTAMFFLPVAILVFMVCRAQSGYKLLGIVCSALVIYTCVQRQTSLNEEYAKADIFSGFGGWQIANNSLYCYKHIDLDESSLPDKRLQAVDIYVKKFIDSLRNPADNVGSAYIWDIGSPLKQFCSFVQIKAKIRYLSAWYLVSMYFDDYGWYIVRHYPGPFIQYYILPNTANYFYPVTEALENYNSSDVALPSQVKEWFGLQADHISCIFPDLQKSIIAPFPFISLLLNVFNILAILFFLITALPRWKKVPGDTRSLFLTWSIFYFAFMGFTIFAAAVNLRFMDPIFVLGLIFPFILWQAARSLRSVNTPLKDKPTAK